MQNARGCQGNKQIIRIKTHGWEQFYDTLQNESLCLDFEQNISVLETGMWF